MSPKKFYLILTGFGVFSVLCIAAMLYFANTLLQKSSSQLVSVKLENKVIEERERYYVQAKKQLEKYKDLGTTLEKVLPKDKDEARAVAELYKMADESGLQITRISFPASTLGQKTAAKPAAGASSASASKSVAVTQAKTLEGVQGVVYINTAIELEGKQKTTLTYSQIIDFLSKVEKNRRSMQISSISVNSTEKENELAASVGLNIFVKP